MSDNARTYTAVEHTVRHESVDLLCAVFLQRLGGKSKGLAGVDHIVYEDSDLPLLNQARRHLFEDGHYLVAHITDQDVLIALGTLLILH